MEINNIFSGAGLIVGLGALAVSYFNIYKTNQKINDREFTSCAITALERAFNALTEGKPNLPPEANRLNWLTAARQIESYKKLKENINSKAYITVCDEAEEHWRHQFHKAINRFNNKDLSYFSGTPIPGESYVPELEIRSVISIYSFSTWNKNRKDPLDSIDIKKTLESVDILSGNIGLEEFLKSKQESYNFSLETANRPQSISTTITNESK